MPYNLIPIFVCLLAAAAALPTVPLRAQVAAAAPSKPPWSFATNYAVRQSVDGNVFLQDVGATARRRSLVTSGTLGVALGYERTPAFKAAFTYAPEIVRYHSYASENHVTHRAAANLSGSSGRASWEFTNSLVRIDGNSQGPMFDVASGGDIPAIGGIPLRDRRDAVIVRNGFKLTHTGGRWLLRPAFNSYVHDFRTQQRARTGPYAGYENYVDRYEVSGGADVGYSVADRTWLVFGHRYGRQHQGELLGAASPYSSSYHRVLAGVEGSPAGWLRMNLLAGPDIRSFKMRPAGFDAGEMLWFVNASLSWLPTGRDTVTAVLSRYQQPAFSSHSVYEDIVYEIGWRRQHTKKLAAAAGFRLYGGDWQAPVNREDWVYTPSASLSYSIHRRLTAEAAYSHDSVESVVPNTRGREFTRHLFTVAVRGSW